MTITLTREQAQQVLDALEKVTKQMLSVRDELAERGARPVMNPHHQTLWDNSFKAYTEHAIPAGETLRARLSAPEPEPNEIETLKQCLFQMQEALKEQTKASDRLVRIMGTFDLATGHADGWNDLLDSLESELRDVLGHYREALKAQPEPEPVAYLVYDRGASSQHLAFDDELGDMDGCDIEPLYTAPPQCKEWQRLTDEEIKKERHLIDWTNVHTYAKFARAIEAKLKEKNT